MRSRWLALLVVLALATVGCPTGSPPTGQATVTPTTTGVLPAGVPTEGARPPAENLPQAAEPGRAPIQTSPIPGRLIFVGDAPEGVVVDAATRIVAVAKRSPNELVLINADTGIVTVRVPLPGFVRHLQLAKPGGPVLVPVESANALVRIELPGGQAESQIVTGTVPHDASEAANGTVFVANEHGGTMTAIRGDDIVKVFTDSVQPAGLASVGSSMGLLDVRKNDLTIYDTDTLTIVGSTPAGDGPTHLVADKHGRMIATDTRGNAVRVFAPRPQPRQIGIVEQRGSPYGIAYDAVRDRLWVASSGANEVVGYDMAADTPREVTRIATVQNPYTLGVDATTGHLFIASATGGVVQIVEPSA